MKITIEGIDGSGKSRLIRLLKDQFPAVYSAEPTPAGRAKLVIALQQGAMDKDAAGIFLEDRTNHLRDLATHQDQGEVVIIDRHLLSTIAYQGAGGADPAELANTQLTRFPQPDLTILIDLDVPIAQARIQMSTQGKEARSSTQVDAVFEGTARQEKTRKIYHQYLGVGAKHAVVIDGTRSPEDVAKVALDAIQSLRDGRPLPEAVFCIPRETAEWLQRTTSTGADLIDEIQTALANGLWKERQLADTDYSHVQVLPQILVQDPEGKFAYRTETGRARLLFGEPILLSNGHHAAFDIPTRGYFRMLVATAHQTLEKELGWAASRCSPLEIKSILAGTQSPTLGILCSIQCDVALHMRDAGRLRTEFLPKLKTLPNGDLWANQI